MALIELENVSKKYQDRYVVDDVSFSVNVGEILVIVGASGSGKTTTLKMINSLVSPNIGAVFFKNKNVKEYNLRDLRLQIGYVLQKGALFPNMTVEQNISLIPEMKKQAKTETKNKIIELLKAVDLNPNDYLDRKPDELSGGEQQRIGIVRAFVSNPAAVLMDEPFSALDPILKIQLQDLVKKIQEQLKTTVVFVTHDMDEALKLGDRIAVMQEGKLLQIDTPDEIIKNPANEFVKKMFANSLSKDVFSVYLKKLVNYFEAGKISDNVKTLTTKNTVQDALRLLVNTDVINVKMQNGNVVQLTNKNLMLFINDFSNIVNQNQLK